MPDQFSNFSNPDVGSANNGRQGGSTNGTGDNGEVWNPTGGPNGTGAWEKPGAAPPTQSRTFGSGGYGGTLAYGNRGNDVDGNGNIIQGTSGAARDRDRFQSMAAPIHATGPQIATGEIDQSRGASMSALDLLRTRASGGVTPAQRQLQQQTTGAVNAVQSGAASIKGGAMARAAAGRTAIAQGARTQAIGNQDQAALAAREQADAAGQFFGASSAQRGQDLDLATKQANLNASQRAANDQRDSTYEGLAFDTQKADLNAKLGRTAADVAANDSARRDATARDATTQARQDRAQTIATGTVLGAAQAYGASQGGPQQPPPQQQGSSSESDKRDIEDSDPKAKTAVRDMSSSGMETKTGMRRPGSVSDKEAARLKKQADGMLEANDAQRRASGLSTVDTEGNKSASRGEVSPKERVRERSEKMAAQEDPYGNGYDRGMFARSSDAETAPDTDALLAGIEKQIAEDKPSPINRDDPYNETLFGHGQRGYAASRTGHAGAMFGGRAPVAVHGFERPEHFGPPSKAKKGDGYTNTYDRQIAMSDPAAKQEAYALGRAHQWEQGKTGKPVEWAHEKPGDITDRGEMTGDRGKSAASTNKASGKAYGRVVPPEKPEERSAMQRVGDKTMDVAGPAAQAALDVWEPAPEKPMAPAQAQGPGYFGQLKAMMTSDPEAKKYIRESPMAEANRSMAPSSYEYKPEFTPPEQEEGEENIGPMADKMKADRVAGTAIVTDPKNGMLAIDKTKGLKLVMGGLADLQRQVDKMARAR